MSSFRWEDIDRSLVKLKHVNLAIEMSAQIEADERQIQFENRRNLNGSTVPQLVLAMKERRADEMAQRLYDIYCDVWRTQGYEQSAEFTRAVSARAIQPALRARAGAIAGEFVRFAVGRNFHKSICEAMLKSFQMRMQRLEDSWQRKLEIEAKQCEHAERRLKAAQESSSPVVVKVIEQPHRRRDNAGRRIKSGDAQVAAAATRKPGRTPRVAQSFIICAGNLWREAAAAIDSRVSLEQVKQIASTLDEAGYRPPADYLEGRSARELRAFNSRHANSRTGPIMTWVQLVSLDDKDYLRAMRRLLSRCAKKLDGHPLSGN